MKALMLLLLLSLLLSLSACVKESCRDAVYLISTASGTRNGVICNANQKLLIPSATVIDGKNTSWLIGCACAKTGQPSPFFRPRLLHQFILEKQ